MSTVSVGEIFPADLPPFTFAVPDDLVFIWRESNRGAEAVLLSADHPVPASWVGSSVPWKILGQKSAVRELWNRQLPPLGSRSIVSQTAPRVSVDLSKRSLKWQGQRVKRMVIVDDSATIRKLLRHIITRFQGWEIIGELDSAEKLPAFLDQEFPDLITLDLHLGQVDGAEAMRRFIAPRRVPTLLITSQPKEDGTLVMDALSAGALDYLQKPESGKWEILAEELETKMNEALLSKWQSTTATAALWKPIASEFAQKDFIIAIGSSTGGTQALQDIFLTLPEKIPPILVTQHIPPIFSRALAERLNQICPFEVKEASHGDDLLHGRILIAPGGKHMRLSASGKTVLIEDDDPVNRFKPSVDALFFSVAGNSKVPVVGVILTGMGKDGALGLKKIRESGFQTIAQDESTSVVFGMPREAIAIGAASEIHKLQDISQALVNCSKKLTAPKRGVG